MQLNSICNKNLSFSEQKMYFLHYRLGSNKKNSIDLHYFARNFFLTCLFRAALNRLLLVLHKDVLFHCDTLTIKFLINKPFCRFGLEEEKNQLVQHISWLESQTQSKLDTDDAALKSLTDQLANLQSANADLNRQVSML
jgi:hypothetical protein